MANNLQCIVVTPERAVLDEKVDFVAVPMYDGELGILPGRAPLIGRLGYGELRTQKGSETERYYVDGGFVQINAGVVTVLTERAIEQKNLSVDQATKDLEQALQSAKSPDEQEKQLANQQKARAQLRLAKK